MGERGTIFIVAIKSLLVSKKSEKSALKETIPLQLNNKPKATRKLFLLNFSFTFVLLIFQRK